MAALDAKDRVIAWLKFKDICMSPQHRHLITTDILHKILQLLLQVKPQPRTELLTTACDYAKQISVPLDTACRNTRMHAYIKCKDSAGAKQVLADMIAARDAGECDGANEETYDLMLAMYASEGNMQGAVAFFNRMMDEGFTPTAGAFCALIRGFMDAGDLDAAFQYLNEMKDLHIDWDGRTVNIVVRLYSKLGRVADAEKLVLDAMEGKIPGVDTVDERALTSLMKGYSDAGDHAAAVNIFNLFVTLNQKEDQSLSTNFPPTTTRTRIRPDIIMFTMLIAAHVKLGDIDSAKATLSSMSKYNCHPDALTLQSIVNGLCASGRPKEAELTMQELEAAGTSPFTTEMKCTIVHKYLDLAGGDNDYFTDGIRLFNSMWTSGLTMRTSTFNRVLMAIGNQFDVDHLMRVWNRWHEAVELDQRRMSAAAAAEPGASSTTTTSSSSKQQQQRKLRGLVQPAPKPNLHSHTIIVEALVKCQAISLAVEELRKMLDLNMEPEVQLFIALIEGQVRGKGYLGAAETMLAMRRYVTGKQGDIAEVVRSQGVAFERLVLELLEYAETSLGVDGEPTSTTSKPSRTSPLSLSPLSDVFMSETSMKQEGGGLAPDSCVATRAIVEAKAKTVLGVELFRELAASGYAVSEKLMRLVVRAHHRNGDLVSAVKAWTVYRDRPAVTCTSSASSKEKHQQQQRVTVQPETVTALLECVRDLGKTATARAIIDMVKIEILPLDNLGRAALLSMMARHGWSTELVHWVVDVMNQAAPECKQDDVVSREVVRGVTEALMAGKSFVVDETRRRKVQRDVMGFLEEHWPDMLLGVSKEEVEEIERSRLYVDEFGGGKGEEDAGYKVVRENKDWGAASQ